MLIPVGPVEYRIELVNEYPLVDGEQCGAATDHQNMRIEVCRQLPPLRRKSWFWHEWGHAVEYELDVHESGALTGESFANIVSLAMCALPDDLSRRVNNFLCSEEQSVGRIFTPSMQAIRVVNVGTWIGM